ncbi:unnamed protein product [Phytophthora lilii]|uniref:Unnamed protein product n=1 Tax=Phytophthora lilii TaxID=2077276 RepID=A0A9W6TZC3_9STRA|nr:unnamed protein product [Phytophthora lilii]
MFPVSLRRKTKLVACGWWHTVVVLSADSDINSADEVFSWGSNDYKQLGRSGDAEEKAVDMSVRITDLHLQLQVRSIACGWKHSLLATVQGEVFSWGSGRHGQLGLGNDLLQTNCPKRIDALKDTTVANVFCGWEHSVFRSVSEEVFTCGNNRHGQLGVEQTPAKEVAGVKRKQVNALPIQVMDASDDTASLRAVQLDCGWHFVLCLTDSRELVAWGKGSHGQLGLGVFENASRPQLLPFSHIVRQIACGSEHSMVVTDSGDLYTCGWGEHGNLGTLL